MNALEQRQRAIVKAHEVKRLRAQLKQDLRAGKLDLRAALDESCVQTMRVYDLVRAMFAKYAQWGHARAATLLATAEHELGGRINPSRRVGDLTDRQKRALVQACEGDHHG